MALTIPILWKISSMIKSIIPLHLRGSSRHLLCDFYFRNQRHVFTGDAVPEASVAVNQERENGIKAKVSPNLLYDHISIVF